MVPTASINWDLTGSINLLPLFWALSYFFVAVETRMEIYASFPLIEMRRNKEQKLAENPKGKFSHSRSPAPF